MPRLHQVTMVDAELHPPPAIKALYGRKRPGTGSANALCESFPPGVRLTFYGESRVAGPRGSSHGCAVRGPPRASAGDCDDEPDIDRNVG